MSVRITTTSGVAALLKDSAKSVYTVASQGQCRAAKVVGHQTLHRTDTNSPISSQVGRTPKKNEAPRRPKGTPT